MPNNFVGTAIPSQGTYNASTNIWTLGSLATTVNATLIFSGYFAVTGCHTNTATITS